MGVLEPMVVLYWPPERAPTAEEQLDLTLVALREYVTDLAEFSDDVLRQGWLDTRRAQAGGKEQKPWPRPEVIRAACMTVRAKMPAYKPQPQATVSNALMVEAWLRSPNGQRALSEGWAVGGCVKVERTGEVLDSATFERERAAFKRLERWALHPDECPASHPQIVNWVKTTRERTDALAEQHLKREVA